jgi:hypothetical protein
VKYLLKILASRSQRKHAYRWLCSLRESYLIDTEIPWITFDAITHLEKYLKRDINVFEYGSGGSTLFWLRHHAICTSVEHDSHWFSLIHDRVGQSPQLNYRLVLPETNDLPNPNKDVADPQQYLSASPPFENHTFRSYVKQIDDSPDNFFDVVLIDGRARPACIAHSTTKIKVGGLLILDNAERSYYTAKTRSYLDGFQRKTFFGVGPCGLSMWQTDLYIRQK